MIKFGHRVQPISRTDSISVLAVSVGVIIGIALGFMFGLMFSGVK